MNEELVKEWELLLDKLVRGQEISREEAKRAFSQILNAEVTDALSICFLTSLSIKGLTVDEILGLSDALRKSCLYNFSPPSEEPIVGITGTGGSTIKKVNVSTTAFFVAAGAGVLMGKSGGRGVSTKAGSADVLECLGVNLYPHPDIAKGCLKEIGLAFAYGGKEVIPWLDRLERLSKRVDSPALLKCIGASFRWAIMPGALNLLKATRYLRGIIVPETEKVAGLVKAMGYHRALVVYGKGPKPGDTLDEISNVGQTLVTELKDGDLINYTLTPEDFGLPLSSPEEIAGGREPEEQARFLVRILKGEEKGPRRDIVLMNTSALIYLADKARNFKEGVELALESILKGKALEKLRLLVSKGEGDPRKLEAYL